MIETQAQAIAAIEEFYAARNEPTPPISEVQILHSDSAICTIRFKAQTQVSFITYTIKIVGSSTPTLLE